MNKKKKILCVIGQLGNGGSEKQLYLFLKHIDREKFEPYVIVSSSLYIDKWKHGYEDELKISVKSLGLFPPIVKFFAYKFLLWKFQPDIIFSWSFYTNPFVIVSGMIPFVGSLRGGIEEERAEMGTIHFKFALKPEIFIVNSERLICELSGENIESKQIVLVKNIYDSKNIESVFSPKKNIREKYDIPNNAVLVAGGGRNSDSKDFPFWLNSFEHASKRNPNLYGILFGYGPEVILGKEIKKRGLNNKIILTGETSEVPDILEQSDIFFLSSLYEGLPNVVLEAIDAGCQILTTDTAGIRDIFQENNEILSSVMIEERSPELAGMRLLEIASAHNSKLNHLTFANKTLSQFAFEKIMPQYLEVLCRAEQLRLRVNLKKKILCVIGQLGNGGSEKQLYLFLKHLDRKKYEPYVIVSSNLYIDKWKKRFEDELKIKVRSFGFFLPIVKILVFKFFLWKFKADVVFSWSFYTNPFVSVCGEIPFIGSLRGGIKEEKKELKSTHFQLALRPEKFIVNSRHLKNDMLSEGIYDNNIYIVRNIFESSGIDKAIDKLTAKVNVRRKYKLPDDSIIISGGGGTSVSKNFPFWVETFELLFKKNHKIRGILFGDGPEKTIVSYIKKRGLEEQIIITGDLPDISDILKASEIFFLSSISEGFPNVLVEAIDARCVPFSADVGGVRDIFSEIPEEYLCRVIFENHNVNTVSEQLLQLVVDEKLRNVISENARLKLKQLSSEKILPQYIEILFHD